MASNKESSKTIQGLERDDKKNTSGSREAAMSHFNVFMKNHAKQKNHHKKAYRDLNAPFLEHSYQLDKILREFAQYLFDSKLKTKSATQYLSNMKNRFKKDFENISAFSPSKHTMNEKGNPQWYSKIYKDLNDKCVGRAHAAGENVVDKAEAIDRDGVCESSRALLKRNTPDSVRQSTQLVMLWSAMGRATELSLTSWNTMSFDTRELDSRWKEQKTFSETPMRYPKDREDFACCVIHGLGRYLIIFQGDFKLPDQDDDDSVLWLFPDLKGYTDGYISTLFTKLLRDLKNSGEVEGLPDHIRIHGLRAGNATYLGFHPDVADIDWIFRGGWASDLNKLKSEVGLGGCELEYVRMAHGVSVAGKFYLFSFHITTNSNIFLILGLFMHMYKNLRRCPTAPNLDAVMNEDVRRKLENLTDELFCRNDCHFLKKGGRLRKFAYTMLACQLMDLKNLEECCNPGEKNIVAEKIIAAGIECDFLKKDLYEMGDAIRDAWLDGVDQASNLDGGREVLQKVADSMERNAELRKEVMKLRNEIHDLKVSHKKIEDSLVKNVNEMSRNMEKMTSAMEQMQRIITRSFESGIMPQLPSAQTAQSTEQGEPESQVSSQTQTSASSSKKREKNEPTPVNLSYKNKVDHTNAFAKGKPYNMSLTQFLANVIIWGIDLEQSSPFEGFTPDSTAKGKYLKLYRYAMKKIILPAENEVLEKAKEGTKHGIIIPENRQDVHDTMSGIARRLSRIIDDAYFALYPKKKKDRSERTGTCGNRLDTIEKENRKLPKEQQDTFFIYVKK